MKVQMLLHALVCCPAICQVSVAPPWIQVLPERPGRIYAVGTATVAPSESKALEQAAQNARFEVLARLRVSVQGTTTVTATLAVQKQSRGPAVGSSQQHVRQEGTTSIHAANLPGLVVEERYVDRMAGAAYALAYLDVGAAEAGLSSQIGALQAEWNAVKSEPPPTELRPSICRIQRIRTLITRNETLEKQALLLIPAGVTASAMSQIQSFRQDLSQEASSIQKSLTMGAKIEGGDLGQDILAILRNTVIKQGFVWNQQQASVFLVVNLRGNKQGWDIHRKAWWEFDASRPDFVVARATIRVGIADAQGNQQDSFDLPLKGVGTDAFTAEQALLKELKRNLPGKFQEFLTELIR